MRYLVGDTATIRRWLEVRKKTLERWRVPYEPLWKTIRAVFEPSIGRALKGDIELSDDSALRDDKAIINSRPRDLLHRMAAGLQSGITNQARQWFRMMPQESGLTQFSSVRKYTDRATEALQEALNRSNIYPALDQVYMHLGAFGTAAALVVPDKQAGMRMIVCDTGSFWISEDRAGRVDTLMRRLRMTYSQLRDEFGMRALPEYIKQNLKEGLHEDTVTVFNLIFPADSAPKMQDVAEERQFVSVYWLDNEGGTTSNIANHGILDVRSFSYNPIIAPRWTVRASTPYGVGPGEIGLGDALELQELERASLKIVAMEANPALAAPASMRDEPMDSSPGAMVFYPDTQGGNIPVQRLYETHQSLDVIQAKISAVEARLSQTFYSDLFAMMINLNMAPKTMTAREVTELSSEKVALLGPILTRMNDDLLRPLVDACWAILVEAARENAEVTGVDDTGILEAPSQLAGKTLQIEFVSSLHAEQMASARLNGLDVVINRLGTAAQFVPDILDNFDGDEYANLVARSSYENGIIRDKKDVEQIRQGRAIAQQQQMQAAQQLQAAQTAKELSKAKLRGGKESALDAITDTPETAGGQYY